MNLLSVTRSLLDVSIFLVAVLGTYLAQTADRPITAVLVFLTGVIVVAFRSGLISALIAAISASLIYNFFLSEPTFRFGITSTDEAVPLLAFNISAIFAAALVGRLKDSAKKSYEAQSETAFLLTVSDRLQSAVKVEEVEAAVRGVIPRQGVTSVEIFLSRGSVYVRPSTGEVEFDTLRPILGELDHEIGAQVAVFELEGARGSLGMVKFVLGEAPADRQRLSKLQSITAMLALAVERCLLLEELAEAQAQTRSEALKDALLSSVSHDLRTPVTVIQAAAGALSSTQVRLPEPERAQLVTTILDQCARLDRYTAELLDVGHIQSGIAEDRMEIVDLTEIVGLAVKHARVAHPDVEIEKHVSQGPLQTRANGAMLEQALVNLIDNAMKFGGEAGPVSVRLDHEQDDARITVSDCGPGIALGEQEKVFSRFFKDERTAGKAGMGLGLFIAKGFVEAFNGSIAIESPHRGDGGTRMIVTLPLAASNSPDQASR